MKRILFAVIAQCPYCGVMFEVRCPTAPRIAPTDMTQAAERASDLVQRHLTSCSLYAVEYKPTPTTPPQTTGQDRGDGS